MSNPKRVIPSWTAVPYGGGFSINRKDLGLVGSASTFSTLLRVVSDYRKANGLPIGLGFPEDLQQAVCDEHPDQCQELPDPTVPALRERSMGEALTGTMVMLKVSALHLLAKLLGSSPPVVDDAEAARRAAICARCPWRCVVRKFCGNALCGEMQSIVKWLVGSRVTPSDGALNGMACGVCTCYLQAAVWVSLDLQWNSLNEEQQAQFRIAREKFGCWKCL